MESKMSRFFRLFAISVVIFSLIIGFWGRRFSGSEINDCSKGETYFQNFKTEAAILVQEKCSSGPSFSFGSAFLINKQTGEFATAAHCVELLGGSRLVLFHNGKIYECIVSKKFIPTDLAIVKIKSFFKNKDLSEPLKMAPIVSIGEKVWVRGFHWHANSQNLLNQNNRKVFDIRKRYLKFSPWLPKTISGEEKEVIFENFEAIVMDTACKINLSVVPSIKLQTPKDHFDTFRGLSGAPVVNVADELVGIVFAAPLRSGWVDFFIGRGKYIPYDTLYIIPSCELEKLIFSSGSARR